MPATKRQKIRKLARTKVDIKKFTFIVKAGKKEEEPRIRSHLEKVNAICLTHAVNKALALNPGKKVVVTKFYQTYMDLITAKKDGLVKSKQERSTIYVNVYPAGHPNEGDCYFGKAPSGTTQAILIKGVDVKINSDEWKQLMSPGGVTAATKTLSPKTAELVKAVTDPKLKKKIIAEREKKQKEVEKQNIKIMEAKVKKGNKAAKVAAKVQKAEGKKSTSNGKSASAKADVKKEFKLKAGQKWMAVKDILKLIAKGEQRAYNKDAKPLPVGYLTKMADHNKEIVVSFAKVEA